MCPGQSSGLTFASIHLCSSPSSGSKCRCFLDTCLTMVAMGAVCASFGFFARFGRWTA